MPLTLATAAFLLVLLWRVRPQVGWGRQRGASRQAVKEARAKVDAATTEPEKAAALCDAAELLGPASATAMYLRAVRADPSSPQVIDRAAARLSRRPRLLESVLWRHLASSSWTDTRLASRASLSALVTLYEGPLRDPVRARALAHARDGL